MAEAEEKEATGAVEEQEAGEEAQPENEEAPPEDEEEDEDANPEDEEAQAEEPAVQSKDIQQPAEQIAEKPSKDQPRPSSPSSKKTKIQVDLNASLKDTADNIHYLSALPVVPEQARVYSPILYTFRVKAKSKTTRLRNVTTKPPPFYLQFDQTIPVIWSLFNKESNRDNLGIVQLQWALYFLSSIYNNEGVHSKDVQLCIDAIQDYLIDEYAEMSEESVLYGSGKSDNLPDSKPKEVNLPFSINYAQMIEKAPAVVARTDTEGDLIDKELLEELENVKKVVGIDSIDISKVVSKDQVLNILNDWKNEQIDKIQEELKMLYVVEDMMKNSDEQKFEGYTDEKQFETIFRRNTEREGKGRA